MNGSNPWLRFAGGIIAIAIAVRLAVELITPILGFLIGAIAVIGLLVILRWWRANRW